MIIVTISASWPQLSTANVDSTVSKTNLNSSIIAKIPLRIPIKHLPSLTNPTLYHKAKYRVLVLRP